MVKIASKYYVLRLGTNMTLFILAYLLLCLLQAEGPLLPY